jgi:ParB-like chromosome segregation protein Spo0J
MGKKSSSNAIDVKRQAQLAALRSSLQAERSNVATQPAPLESRFARADALAASHASSSQPPVHAVSSQPPVHASSHVSVHGAGADVGGLVALAMDPGHRVRSEEVMLLDDIVARENDLRPLRPSHVKDLAASIATVGLIQPPAVDVMGRLLAGEHRRSALELLRLLSNKPDAAAAEWPELDGDDHARIAAGWKAHGFDKGIPVRRMPFDAEQDRARALAVEATENEKRTDFSRHEVREVVEKLKAAGFRAAVGRPKKGEKALSPQLAIIFGKSQRQVFNYLAELRGDENTTTKPKRARVDPMASRLQERLGLPVVIRRNRSGHGRVELAFSSEEQLEQLLGTLAH